MNVRELTAKLSRMDPDAPVVIDQEDRDLVGTYVEVMDVRFTESEVYFDADQFSLDGSRPYDRADWHNTGSAGRNHPTEPVVLLNCLLQHKGGHRRQAFNDGHHCDFPNGAPGDHFTCPVCHWRYVADDAGPPDIRWLVVNC
jgi:hypothetical protein